MRRRVLRVVVSYLAATAVSLLGCGSDDPHHAGVTTEPLLRPGACAAVPQGESPAFGAASDGGNIGAFSRL